MWRILSEPWVSVPSVWHLDHFLLRVKRRRKN